MNSLSNTVGNGLWMNHISLDTDQLDMFSLLPKIRREAEIFSRFSSLGFERDATLELLSAPSLEFSVADLSWGPSFQFDTKDVIWWNNLEKDRRYFMFPSDINAVIVKI